MRARRFWPVMALMALDLPALERPAKATSTALSAGQSCRRAALISKRANWKLIAGAGVSGW
jgi:hypothetical protein